jgi:hypothetical protein
LCEKGESDSRQAQMGVSSMVKRVRLEKTKSKSKSMTLASARWTLFDQPQLLAGEDAATYHELLAHVRAAVKPVDIIDDMFIDDVASLEWEVLRWRRLKTSLIRACGLAALEHFLPEKLDYDLYSDRFADQLTEILQENLPEDQTEDFAQTLAQECARNEPDAVEKVNKILADIGQNLDRILENAQTDKAKDLVQQYVRLDPDAVTLINELLAQDGSSMDDLVVDALSSELDSIERIDRLTTVAEGRRNASLREIDRRRVMLGETLRRTVQEVEEGEFEVIEATPAKGKKAA